MLQFGLVFVLIAAANAGKFSVTPNSRSTKTRQLFKFFQPTHQRVLAQPHPHRQVFITTLTQLVPTMVRNIRTAIISQAM
jgi:hypothetical protein